MVVLELTEFEKKRIAQMRKLLNKEKNIKEEWFNDHVIMMYLRVGKFDLEKTITRMKRMVNYVINNPEFFQPMDIELKRKVSRQKICNLYAPKNNEGRLFIETKIGNWDPAECTYQEVMRFAIMEILHGLAEIAKENSSISLYDWDAPISRFLSFCRPYYLYSVYNLYCRCIPMRLTCMHFINVGPLCQLGKPLLMSMLSQKVKSRLFIHSKPGGEMLKYVGPEELPVAYGGHLKDEGYTEEQLMSMTLPDYIISILDSVKKPQKN